MFSFFLFFPISCSIFLSDSVSLLSSCFLLFNFYFPVTYVLSSVFPCLSLHNVATTVTDLKGWASEIPVFPLLNFKLFWEKNDVSWFCFLFSPECRWPIIRESNELCPVSECYKSQCMKMNKLILCPSLWFVLSHSLLN